MKLASMQPYLFPYLGYFQLIRAAGRFVVSDDVQYIRGGWINRNRILSGNKPLLFTFSVKRASHSLNINERYFSEKNAEDKKGFIHMLHSAYAKAPYYDPTIRLIHNILENREQNVSHFIEQSIKIH